MLTQTETNQTLEHNGDKPSHNQSGLAGYPAGTINRQNFPGQEQGNNGTTALSRGQWAGASNTVLGQASYANTAVTAVVDVQTRIMTIDVEAYYTDNSPLATQQIKCCRPTKQYTGTSSWWKYG